MNVIVCIDNRMGMLFNHRRQSQDRILREYLLNLTAGRPLLMNAYSRQQFEDRDHLTVREDFLSQARQEDYCFVENQPLTPWEEKISQLIVCKWNRDYPGDQFLDLDLARWHLKSSRDFPGSSHENITVEVYEK